MNDTRSKLETLFRRLTDPTVSDLEALADFVWFRKLALDAKDVSQALGAPAAPSSTSTSTPSGPPVSLPAQLDKPTTTPGTKITAGSIAAWQPDEGPMWPFKKKHAGESIAHIAKVDPDYLRYALRNFSLREPLLGNVKAALERAGEPFTEVA